MTSAQRASAAERAVASRHLRRVCGLPGTVLGRSAWPPRPADRLHWHWNYWWQAHLLDCLVDAQLRAPDSGRARLIARFARSIRLRNLGGWLNDYYDDIAWLALALQRAHAVTGLEVRVPVTRILERLRAGWSRDGGGGIWWRRGDRFKNAPANGPAAIAHARAGETERARELLGWMTGNLVDPATGLVWDGLRVAEPGQEEGDELVTLVYTYCQGVYLGACLELSDVDSAVRTVRAVAAHCAPGGVLRGQGGGDGGLFAGILARYLALAARELPPGEVANTAAGLVRASARACWRSASTVDGLPLFSPEWTEQAPDPGALEEHPARDLSVQLGAWMLLEAAAALNSAAAGGAVP
ncbi:glycoside hydrolase family 76 protein [Amycolatopsis aidingensis]|uniref:glycoside hydrolase family 76 protein n=1 Tax=Amycolatopsis aidingensis TaxID=2842453 RepID=UPI001C0D1AE1|nr:glycoside hydrolase family 76 protein [Amycolatopsis aidingensis]